jgi:hypothetical protein
MKETKYIHYGHTSFDINKFKPICNKTNFTKPLGGFWASRVDSKLSWKNWCIDNDYCEINDDNTLNFKLKKDSNILEIHSVSDLEKLPKLKTDSIGFTMWTLVDFEELVKQGYDGMEVFISDDYILYYSLYGWDCDSIVIFNPDCIEIEE